MLSLLKSAINNFVYCLLMKRTFSIKSFIEGLTGSTNKSGEKELKLNQSVTSNEMPKLVHVDICQINSSNSSTEKVICLVQNELQMILSHKNIPLNKTLTHENFEFSFSNKKLLPIKSLYLSTGSEDEAYISYHTNMYDYQWEWHVYRLNEEEAASETAQNDGDEISASTSWILPSSEFYLLWDNLFYNENIKEQLLRYVETAMCYSERGVNPQVINWNKVVLLHGPPGTGKTSLCKALAQKITIRLSDKFTHGQLVEINSHSLFSKWFSESGKLVMNLFNKIRELLEDKNNLVCILIDEVESLAHARKACSNGSEPSDSIRVVNALLTQLDSLKRHPNVLILTTSNLTEAIDVAFVDRADIKQYIPPPNEVAIYKIYTTCLRELMRTKLIEKKTIYEYTYLPYLEESSKNLTSFELYQLARESVGLSGRTLRKIPFLAHALHGQMKTCQLNQFIQYMRNAIKNESKSRQEFIAA